MALRLEHLLTQRLLLRGFVDSDFDALRAIDSDPEILRYRSRSEITPEATREFLIQAEARATEQPRQQYAFAVVLREGGRLVGQVGLTIVSSGYNEAFMWYSTNRQYWGQGYATEAAGRLLRYGFDQAGLRRIFAECHPDNLASARVMEKIGMIRETVAAGGPDPLVNRLRYGMSK